jgi:hypothetical protein
MAKYITWYGKYITYGTEFVVDGAPTPPPPPQPPDASVYWPLKQDYLEATGGISLTQGDISELFVNDYLFLFYGKKGPYIIPTDASINNIFVQTGVIFNWSVCGWFELGSGDPADYQGEIFWPFSYSDWTDPLLTDDERNLGIFIDIENEEMGLQFVTETHKTSFTFQTSVPYFFVLQRYDIGNTSLDYRLYVNGVLVLTKNVDRINDYYISISGNNTEQLGVFNRKGEETTGNHPFITNRIALFSKALTTEEIDLLYNNGSGI